MLQIPTVTTLAHEVGDTVATLAHEVATKAQDAAQVASERSKEWGQVAGERGKEWSNKAVVAGRQTLQSTGIIAKPAHKGRNVLLLVAIAVIGLVAFRTVRGRQRAARSSSRPETDRLADQTHVKVA